MSTRRSGLFSRRPDLLLVDETPPGIKLPELAGQAGLPELEEDEEPQPELAVDYEPDQDDDEDSYDGEGPLRIFIGPPAGAPDAVEAPAPATLAAEQGPVWDASALALGAQDDTDEIADDTESDRAPVLVRPGEQPPPLTMSFGGSFSRGSMDAGVMDADGVMVDDEGPGRPDTVVIHDRIYDRLVRFDDPTLPASAGPAGGEEDDTASVDVLAAGAAEDDSSELISAGDVADGVEPGPPPTRLRVGFVPGRDEEDAGWDDDVDDDLSEDDLRDDGLLDDELGEDEDGDALDSLDRRLGEAMRRGLSRTLQADEDEDEDEDGPPPPRVIIRDEPSPTAPGLADTAPGVEDETDARPLVVPPPPRPPAPAAPDWAVRRRAAQVGTVRAGADVQDDEEEEGGGVGLLVFVVVSILVLVAAWWFYGREGATGLSVLGGGDSPEVVATDDGSAAAELQDPGSEGAVGAGATAEGAAAEGATAKGGTAEGVSSAKEPPGADAAPASGVVIFVPDGVDPSTVDPADMGIVRVRAARPARIYIDGRKVGQTPMNPVRLPAGEYKIKAVAISSGRSRVQTVRVDAGRAQELRFTF
ncbi:MAG: PEGA domain-containing protein [Deltaproteobacteria bacterium]|nr:MAG: PEGA domain-containing protein [Deltaproteobacteria bacterium]